MTKCSECKGEGLTERTKGSGDDQVDVQSWCEECCGTGYVEAAEMLRTLCMVRDADLMAVAERQQGLGGAMRSRVAKALAPFDYSQLRYAEMKR